MLEDKKTFRYFAVTVIFLGVLVFFISLLFTMSIGRSEGSAKTKVIYFDQKILPDHLFYPLLVAIDRLELKMAPADEVGILELKYAQKRMQAAKALFYQEKNELAFVTLGKAHQYLLHAHQSLKNTTDKLSWQQKWQEIQIKFLADYVDLKERLDDSQKAKLDIMISELKTTAEVQIK